MSDLGNKEVFSRNLKKYMDLHQVTRTDMTKAIRVAYTTFNDWYNGVTYPRIDKIELMASYFGILKSDLIESKPENDQSYCLNPETQRIGQEIFENKDLRLLFDAARNASPEDLKTAHDILKALKAKEQGDYD